LIVITWLELIAELAADELPDDIPLVMAGVALAGDAAAFVFPRMACAISTTATRATMIPPASSADCFETPVLAV
jgi:hypothetical protein